MKKFTFIIGLLATFLGQNAVSKELYLTVFRDFGLEENPLVEVNYLARKPIHFRLLKPRDMRAFIASQVDLKRSWKQPKVEFNSLRYLKIGLNHFSWRTDWIRRTVDSEMRTGFKDRFGGGRFTGGPTPLTEGQKKIVATPADFDLVSEEVIYPEATDAVKPFDVPGFDGWFSSFESGFKSKTVTLQKLKPGFYVVQVTQGPLEGQVVLVVNDIMTEVQQSNDEAIVRASRRSGSELSSGVVEVRNIQGEWSLRKELDSQGFVHLKGLPPGPLLFVVNDRSDQFGTAIVDAEFLPSSADFPDLYLFSDRPVYRPGDDIFVKGILRKARGGLSRILNILNLDDSKVSTHLEDLDAQVKGSVESSTVNSFGSFSGSLKAPLDSSGLFRIKSQFSGADHIGEVRVQEYVKPLYYLTAQSDQRSLKAGETLKVKVNVERFAGGTPKGMTLRADLYRERYQLPEWVETEGLDEKTNLGTYGFDQSTHRSPSVPIIVVSQSDLKFDESGFLELAIKVPEVVPGDPQYDYSYRLNLFAYDSSGETASKVLSFLDTRSEVIGQVKSHLMIKKSSESQIQVFSSSPDGKVLESVQGTIEWSFKAYRGSWTKVSDESFLTDKNGLKSLRVPTDRVGELAANIVLLDSKGQKTLLATSLLVVDSKSKEPVSEVENMKLLTNTTKLNTGESSEILVLLPENWGDGGKNSGNLNITVAGRTIYYTKKIATKGTALVLKVNAEARFGSSFYVVVSYPDPQKGWIQQQLGFSVIPAQKILSIAMDFANKEITPGSEQTAYFKVTDYQGKPVSAELALSVIDEAVYRIQEEFRPNLIDFFYPAERLNMMTFVSHHFQTFGYGEKIAGMFRPNFFHGAPKSEKLKTDRDTGYWNPSILTRDDGTAEVTFALPTNQTLWRATAIAIDRNGSFGEVQGGFRANREVSLVASWPRALRSGDQINVDLKVAAQSKLTPEKFTVAMESKYLSQLTANSILEGVIKPGSEVVVSMGLELKEVENTERSQVKTQLNFQGKRIEYVNDFRVIPNKFEYLETGVFDSNGATHIVTKPGESIEQVKLTVASGLSGTLESAAQAMIQYPYGCAEQLASSLLVNVIHYRLLSGEYVREVVSNRPIGFWWHGIKDFFSKSWFNLVSLRSEKIPSLTQKTREKLQLEASQFYHAGLSRLKHYQNDDGSLTWWPGIGQSDLSMTLIVLDTILALDDLDLNETFDVLKAWRWLEVQPLPPDSPHLVLRLAIYGRLVSLGLLPKPDRSHQSFSQWQFLVEKYTQLGDSSESIRDLAWIALGILQSGLSQEPDFKNPMKLLQESLIRQFDIAINQDLQQKKAEQNDRISPDINQWDNYPGTSASHLAVAGKALYRLDQMPIKRLKALTSRLLSHFDGSRFMSTFETATILGNSEYILSREAFDLVYQFHKPKIFFQTKEVTSKDIQFSPHIGGYSAVFSPGNPLAGQHELKVSGLSSTEIGAVSVRKKVGYKDLKPHLASWNIERKMYLLDSEKNDIQEISQNQIKIGDIVYIKIRFSPKPGVRTSSYLMVEDSLPTGVAPIMEDKSYLGAPWNLGLRPKGPYKREFLVDRVRFHLQSSSESLGGEREVGYLVRAVHQGVFQGGMIRIEDMYQDRNYSHYVTPVLSVRRI